MLIGLTGGIASGKSTVTNFFREFNIPVIDSDTVAREVVEPGKEAWAQIVEYFGDEILLPTKELDRKKLGNIIFNDQQKREILNNITHPIIISEIMTRAKELHLTNKNVVIDIPLLFESKREELFDLIIVVYVNKEIQLQRLMKRDNIAENEAITKIKAQIDLEEKRKKADIVIYNEKSLEDTREQVKQIVDKL